MRPGQDERRRGEQQRAVQVGLRAVVRRHPAVRVAAPGERIGEPVLGGGGVPPLERGWCLEQGDEGVQGAQCRPEVDHRKVQLGDDREARGVLVAVSRVPGRLPAQPVARLLGEREGSGRSVGGEAVGPAQLSARAEQAGRDQHWGAGGGQWLLKPRSAAAGPAVATARPTVTVIMTRRGGRTCA